MRTAKHKSTGCVGAWLGFCVALLTTGTPVSSAADTASPAFIFKLCTDKTINASLVAQLKVLSSPGEAPLADKDLSAFKHLMASTGWPTVACGGVQGIDLAGELVYRSSQDADFQQVMLLGINDQVDDDIDPRGYMGLADAIRLRQNGTQSYGTVFKLVDGKAQLVGRLRDDKRLFFRDFYGLPTLEEDELAFAKKGQVVAAAANRWQDHLGRLPPVFTRPDIRKQLVERISLDQEARRQLYKEHGQDQKRIQVEVRKIDAVSVAFLHKLFAEVGWPDVAMVGRDGVSTVFLLVQHADSDPAFQQYALGLAEPLVRKRQLSHQQYAYLVDRVRLAQGQGQLYGSQGEVKDGKAVLRKVEDPANLDRRRAEMQMGPEADYLKLLQAQYDGA